MKFQQLHRFYGVESRERSIMNDEFRWMWKIMAYVNHSIPLNRLGTKLSQDSQPVSKLNKKQDVIQHFNGSCIPACSTSPSTQISNLKMLFQKHVILDFAKQVSQEVNALDLYSAGARFESRSRHRPSWEGFHGFH
jgi:hypothetical protein